MQKYTCPVCGYPELLSAPRDHSICPSCGTEFGYDDNVLTHEELRGEWIKSGADWFSKSTPIPTGWNPFRQMRTAGIPSEHWNAITTRRIPVMGPRVEFSASIDNGDEVQTPKRIAGVLNLPGTLLAIGGSRLIVRPLQ